MGIETTGAPFTKMDMPSSFLARPAIRLIHLTGSPIATPQLSADQEQRLMDLFRDDVRRLREYTVNALERWRKY